VTWYNQGWQDGVKFDALERLDLVDARALQDIVYTQLHEMVGGLLGAGSGALGAFTSTGHNDGATWYVDIGAFQFYYSFPARRTDGSLIGDGITKGFVITHDPLDSGQSSESTLDVTPYRSIAQGATYWDAGLLLWKAFDLAISPWLWARPTLIDTDTDARRKWDVGTSAEVAYSPDTRLRTRVEFQLNMLDPNLGIPSPGVPAVPTEQPWVKVGRVVDWVTGALPEYPVIAPLSAWDNESLDVFTREPGASAYGGTQANADAAGIGPAYRAGDGTKGDDAGTEFYYGKPPIPGHTSGFSPFLLASDYGEGANKIDAARGNFDVDNSLAPHGGLIAHNHIVRSRLKQHLQGLSTSPNGDNWKDSQPWYEAPAYGLRNVKEEIDNIDPRVDALEAWQALWQAEATPVVARTEVRWIGQNSTPDWARYNEIGIVSVTNLKPDLDTDDPTLDDYTTGVMEIVLVAGITPRSVAVQRRRNSAVALQDSDTWGTTRGAFTSAVGKPNGFRADVYDVVDIGGGQFKILVLTHRETVGTAAFSYLLWGSFDLIVYGVPA
jgi:hypothetical protein